VVAIAFAGDYTYFGQPQVSALAAKVTPEVLVVAAACGLGGGLFSLLTLKSTEWLPAGLQRLRSERSALFAGFCGLLVAALGALSGSLTYGTGYDEARLILEGNAHLPWEYGPARALATLLILFERHSCGPLAPSLSVGAGLGQVLADQLGQPSMVPFAILGMCGFLAGVTQAPVTSFVIVMEMTAQHAMVLPLMLTAAVAHRRVDRAQYLGRALGMASCRCAAVLAAAGPRELQCAAADHRRAHPAKPHGAHRRASLAPRLADQPVDGAEGDESPGARRQRHARNQKHARRACGTAARANGGDDAAGRSPRPSRRDQAKAKQRRRESGR
jgi:hypothetical protein